MAVAIRRIHEWGERRKRRVAEAVSEFYRRFGEGMLSEVPTPDQIINSPERYYLVTLRKESVDEDDVAVGDGEVLVAVGAVMMARGELMRIAVHPRYRGRGFGKLLLTHLVRVYYSETGGKTLFLWTRKDDTRMIRLVRKLGFVRAGERGDRVKYVLDLP